MEEHQMCSIVLPSWMEEDKLKATSAEERSKPQEFSPLPRWAELEESCRIMVNHACVNITLLPGRHYMEIAYALLPRAKAAQTSFRKNMLNVDVLEVFGGKEKYRQQIVLLLREIIASWQEGLGLKRL